MKENLQAEIKSFFDEFTRRMSLSQQANFSGNHTFINKILNSDPEILKIAFGEQSLKIIEFFKSVDIDHPDIENCYDGIFSDSSDFISVYDEIYAYAKFGKENNFQKTMAFLQELMNNYVHENYKILSKIDLPENNRCNIRLVPDKQRREKIRSQKKMQHIDLQSVSKKGLHYYNSHPNNFNNFIRFDKTLDVEIKRLKSKAQRFAELGCAFLAQEINDNLQSYQEYVNQTYFGFNRITMSTASIILAKNLEYKYSIVNSYSNNANETLRIFTSQDYFGDYIFDQDNLEIQNDYKSYEYEPKIYPLHAFQDILTDNILSMVNLLENFPEANNKPIFDFFGVIVPSINFPTVQKNGFYTFIDSKGLHRMYLDSIDAKYEFDKHMINSKYFTPILVAEKDHKCYFLSYWI